MPRPSRPLPPIELLDSLLDYNPESGELRWKVDRKSCPAGSLAGHLIRNRRVVWIKETNDDWMCHRIIWALYHREDPYPLEIDHINRNPLDNRIVNLRKVTTKENAYNRNRVNHPDSKCRGVTPHRKKWKVTYGTEYHGLYDTYEEAVEVRKALEMADGMIVAPIYPD
jgi:hypothetical protein